MVNDLKETIDELMRQEGDVLKSVEYEFELEDYDNVSCVKVIAINDEYLVFDYVNAQKIAEQDWYHIVYEIGQTVEEVVDTKTKWLNVSRDASDAECVEANIRIFGYFHNCGLSYDGCSIDFENGYCAMRVGR